MLNKATFPLSNAQITNFILEKEYTNYFTLQQILSDLLDTNLIHTKCMLHTTYYQITPQGKKSLEFFENRLSNSIKEEVDIYLIENKYELRKELNITAEYYPAPEKDYIVHCQVKEGTSILIELHLCVPTEEHAEQMCLNWRNGCQDIYSYVMAALNRH